MRYSGLGRWALILATALGLSVSSVGEAKKKDPLSACDKRYFLNPFIGYDRYKALPQIVQDEYWRYHDSYVDLDARPMPAWLYETAEDVRDDVKESLGYLPRIKRDGTTLPYALDPDRLVVIRLWDKTGPKIPTNLAAGRQGNEIGRFQFSMDPADPNTLTALWIWVDPNFRQVGLSELMLIEALAEMPWLQQLKVEIFSDTNRQIYKDAIKDGMDCEDAIRETPAYKSFVKLGFTEIVDSHCGRDADGKRNARFTAARPKK